MNKIYKLVWNKTRGCYVAAGEFAKRASKGAAGRALAAVVAAGMMTCGFSGSSWADEVNGNINIGANSVINGAVTVQPGSDIYINGDLKFEGTGSFVNQGSIIYKNEYINNIEEGANIKFQYTYEKDEEGNQKKDDEGKPIISSIKIAADTVNVQSDDSGIIITKSEGKRPNNGENNGENVEYYIQDFSISLDYEKIAEELGNANGTIVTVDGEKAITEKDEDGNEIFSERYTSGNLQLKASEENGVVKYDLKLNKDIDLGKDGSVQAGNTTINKDGIISNKITVDNTVIIDKTGIDAGDTNISNVKNGEVSQTSKDAVNGSQLYATNQAVQNNAENISRLGNKVDKLDSKINKVGAGAAALAALHPLDFDPDEKLNVAAGYGHYKGEDAAAVGAFYRPNEDTMFSIGGTVGNGEDMINVGVSFRFGQQNHQTRTKKEMAKEIIDLRMEVAELKAMMYNIAGAGAAVDPAKMQLFPDVPSNHWAYEYVAKLAGNGILEGYPDGNFDGSRTMTRYEMAAIIYRALSRGVNVDERMLKEFGDVLARIRVDVLTRDYNNEPRIERVRVIPKEERKAALAAAGK